MSKKRVLILCTGNSCRSQMAEGLINHFSGDAWQAFSAGAHPVGYTHPLVIKVMQELDIDLSRARSKSTGEFKAAQFDLVITVCDDAAEICPLWLGQGQIVHIGFPDPAKASGTEEEQLQVFRQVRDHIRAQILEYLTQVVTQ